ncbi:helix-turn-helix transcriptional regulator [Thalassotalea sp. LPB0316]|uniref:helix-turn-helix transcriptional regulator n=1 Tax=Thalassotalea sp. LPB0316 TaxID=2769490 RepID=UPI001866D750|nr:helix-turn-helix transcriptional regulator [Thalassotalea sp. LPB0316]QOL25148.1 helix-turn-helix transcriptional regulator [Thalassotalea sp. LPB0316]
MAKILVNNIRVLRFNQCEMTQQALAQAVGVSRQTIVAIEKGKYSPSLEVAFKIADVFSVPIEQVFAYQEQAED